MRFHFRSGRQTLPGKRRSANAQTFHVFRRRQAFEETPRARLERSSGRAHQHRQGKRLDLGEAARGLSWVTIKNIPRAMQRVLSRNSKDKKPPFSQQGLAIPEKDKLRMKIASRQVVSFSWGGSQANRRCGQEAWLLGRSPKEQVLNGFSSRVLNSLTVWRVVCLASK